MTFPARFIKNLKGSQPGFTLVEALVVIGLVGILSLMGYTALEPVTAHYRLKEASRVLMGDLLAAKTFAITSQKQHRLVKVTGESYEVQRGDARTGSTIWDASLVSPSVKRDMHDYAGVTLDDVPVPPVFNPNGTTQANIDLILRSYRGDFKTIHVTLTGRVRID